MHYCFPCVCRIGEYISPGSVPLCLAWFALLPSEVFSTHTLRVFVCLSVCLWVCIYLSVCLSVYCSAYTGRSCKFSSYTLSVCPPVCLCLVYLHRQTGYTVRSQEMAVVVVLMPHSTLRYRDHTLYSTQYKIYIEVV